MDTLDLYAALMVGYDLPDLLERPAWHAQAACRGRSDVTWFPGTWEQSNEAKAVCHGCPVRTECLAAAFEHGPSYGVWAGTSEKERRRLRRTAY